MTKRLNWTEVDCSNLSIREVKELHNQYIKSKLSHDPRYRSLLPADGGTSDLDIVLEWRYWTDDWWRWWEYTGTMGLRSALEVKERPDDRKLFNYGVDPNV
jgi:hypothetical protein